MSKTAYGIIYMTSRVFRGEVVKRYIGQHKLRNGQLEDNYIGSGKLILRAINKYGKESFTRETLEVCYSSKELNLAEIHWIEKYNAIESNLFYNLAEGGGGRANLMRKPVYQYSLQGKLLATHASGIEAAALFSTESTHISKACKKEGRTCAGFQWRLESAPQITPAFVGRTQTVCCYTKEGDVNGVFKSPTEASAITGISTSAIVSCCNGRKLSAGGYQWKYFSGEPSPIAAVRGQKKKVRAVVQVNPIDGKQMQVFTSMTDAATFFNIKVVTISQAITQACLAAGFLWKHHDSDKDPFALRTARKSVPRKAPPGRAVLQMDKSGNVIARHKSVADAARAVGRKCCGIITSCKPGSAQSSCAGFLWKYADA